MKTKAIVILIAVGAIAASAASGESSGGQCTPPSGPGDPLVHSHALTAQGVDCGTAKRVVLEQPGPGSATVADVRWRCRYTSKFPDAREVCTGGRDRRVSIEWWE